MYGRIQSKQDEHADEKVTTPAERSEHDVAPPPPDEIPDGELAAETIRARREDAAKPEDTKQSGETER